jgi:citrate lyase beta subunit
MYDKSVLQYRVGALMYTPALNATIGKKYCENAFPELDSLALCLEDAITEKGVKAAESQLVKTLRYIAEHKSNKAPLLFVRVRNTAQFKRLPKLLGELIELLTGVIFPKFDLSNAAEYCNIAGNVNAALDTPLYIMPTLESDDVINLSSRHHTLFGIKELLDGISGQVLNLRVGAMDFCNLYGLRRSPTQTIYDIGVVSDAMADILAVFGKGYIVSAPVCEHYGGGAESGTVVGTLERELQLDMSNGFIGKTVIHPSQLPVVRKWLTPTMNDYEDAKSILNWTADGLGVMRSHDGNRINELSTHQKWARKIISLSKIYGVRA